MSEFDLNKIGNNTPFRGNNIKAMLFCRLIKPICSRLHKITLMFNCYVYQELHLPHLLRHKLVDYTRALHSGDPIAAGPSRS